MSIARRKLDGDPRPRAATGSRLVRERQINLVSVISTHGSELCGDIKSEKTSDEITFALIEVIVPQSDLRFRQQQIPSQTKGFIVWSGLIHASLLAFALLAFPPVAELPSGGETAIPVEVVIVAQDSVDTVTTEAGAKVDFVIVQQEPIVEPVTILLPQVAVAMPPDQMDLSVIEPIATPAPEMNSADPEAWPLFEPLPRAVDGIVPPQLAPKPARPVPAKVQRDTQADARRREQNEAREEKKEEAAEQARMAEQKRRQLADQVRRQVAAKVETTAPSQRFPASARSATTVGTAGSGSDKATQQARQAGGSTRGVAATAGAATIGNYRGSVLAHLARFKVYPVSAQDSEIQGRTTVSFTITRSGGVTSASLAGSSGAAILDQATLGMVRRAQPFPAMPAGGPASMGFTAVVRYDLR